ncbi:creatininase family protein [Ureibacillus acetophenoni]
MKKLPDYTKLVIIPSGAFEVYGPHLPLGTDTLVSSKIAEILAECNRYHRDEL